MFKNFILNIDICVYSDKRYNTAMTIKIYSSIYRP